MPDDQKLAFQRMRTGFIASSDLVQRMDWKIGDRIFLTGDIFPVTPELTLVGIFDDPLNSNTIYFSQEYLRELLGSANRRQDLIEMVQVQVDAPEDVARVSKAIDTLFDNSPAPTRTESEQAFGLQFISVLGNVKLFLMSICAALTFTILLVCANTISMSVRERAREVGILKTLGYTRGAIVTMIMGEAGLISIAGGAIGLLLAAGLTAAIRQGPAYIQQMKTLSITPDVAAISLGFALLVGVASSLVPAWNASRASILEALRNTG
jgi:putative ABC transport system permease protein